MLLLMVLATSCREESDTVYNYAFNTGLNFEEAQNSYAGKFKVLWKALDQNYAIWDYERELGLDWDAVYDEYLPKYEALDQRNDVTDAELEALLTETVAPLHDGHFTAQMENHQTGGFVMANPSTTRKMSREDFATTRMFNLKLDAYRNSGDIVESKEVNTTFAGQLVAAYQTDGKCYRWAKDEVARLEQLASRTDLEQFQLTGLQSFVSEFEQMFSLLLSQKLGPDAAVPVYNQMVSTYGYLHIPGLDAISTAFNENVSINIKYALFKNNVVFLYFSGFHLTPYLDDEIRQQYFGGDAATLALAQQVKDAWSSWHQKIQELHASGQLRGVIIDVRGNGGGMASDFPNVIGSLVPSGGLEIGKSRFKRGLGRYDYSPLSPAVFPTMEEPHATITEPIAVLCNSCSVSMAEITSQACKVLPNGTLIGKPTHGGLCALENTPTAYYMDYAGIIGTRNTTPVWLYIPVMTTMSKDGQFFESVGVMPDIMVDYDPTLAQSQGRDTQLDRALQFMDTGN